MLLFLRIYYASKIHETKPNEIVAQMTNLANDEPLERKHRDHKLSGQYEGFRECHIRPNLLLIYKKRRTDFDFDLSCHWLA